MRFFPLLDFEHMVLAFFLGLGVLIFLYAAWTGYPPRREEEAPHAEGKNGVEAEHHPMVPMLRFLYAAVALWALVYVIVYGVFGGPIG